MKKVILFLIMFLIPFGVFAETKLKSETLNEVMVSEGIEFNHPNYKEEEGKVNIYLFRGKGCTYCRRFLTFLESVTDEYGKYFNVVAYEVWEDEANNELMENVKEFLGEKKDGVPFFVIGNQKFLGFGEKDGEKVLEAIKKEYDAKKKYDVIKEMSKKHLDKNTIIFIVLFVIVISYIVGNEMDKTKMKDAIEKLTITKADIPPININEKKTKKKKTTKKGM